MITFQLGLTRTSANYFRHAIVAQNHMAFRRTLAGRLFLLQWE